MKYAEEFKSKQQRDDKSDGAVDTGGRVDAERDAEAGHTTTTTTTAVTRTTTTTVSLPDDSTTAPSTVNREPPIIVLQEAPVAHRETGFLDAAAAAVWIERQRTLLDRTRPRRAAPSPRAAAGVATDARSGSRSSAPMSRRDRINRRRQQNSPSSAAHSGRWNDPLTGVLLCPEALEHIVVNSSIVPDPNAAPGPSGTGGGAQTAK